MLLAWREQAWSVRYRQALGFVVRVLSIVFALTTVALLLLEPSWRTIAGMLVLWAIAVPFTALGYMRKLDRMAGRIPATKTDPGAN
jgi:hypothetical protein